MIKRTGRGVGSNQYADKAPDSRSAEDVERVRRLNALGVPSSMDEEEVPIRDSLTQSVARLSRSLNTHFDALMSEGDLSQDGLRSRVGEVAQAEDEIIHRNPNMYGFAVVDSVYWSAQASRDPEIRRKVSDGDPETVQLHEAYTAILKDSTDVEHLDVDELSHALHVVATREDPGPLADEEKESMDAPMMHRLAALSVVSSRDSEGPDEEMLREMEDIREHLKKSMLQKRLRLI